MSLALAVARIREQVAAITPTRPGGSPFVAHVAAGGTMDLRTQATANPVGLHRRFEVRMVGMPRDDGEAAVTTRRMRADLLVVVAYEWGILSRTEDAEVTIGEDAASIEARLYDPDSWSESTTGLMACISGTSRAVRLRDSDVVLLEHPVTIIYH